MERTHRILLAAVALATLALASCPGPRAPLRPPPEYEDPPAAPSTPLPAPAPPTPTDAGPLGDG